MAPTCPSSHAAPTDDNRIVDTREPGQGPAQGVDDQALTVSRFRATTATQPEPLCLPWADLVTRLGHFQICADKAAKAAGALWSAATYRPGDQRRNQNVVAVTALVADIDDGTPLEALAERLDALDYVVYSTYSHTPAHPKLRVVIRLIAPIPGDRYQAVWAQANAHLFDHHCDEHTRDQAHMYFWPQVQPGVEPVHVYHPGQPLDWRALPPLPTPSSEPSKIRTTPAGPTHFAAYRARKMLEKWRADLAVTPPGQRHATLLHLARAAGGLVASGLLAEAAASDMLNEGAVACGLVDDDRERNVERTISDGLRDGALKPWVPDDLGGRDFHHQNPWPINNDVDAVDEGQAGETPDDLPTNVVELQRRLRQATAARDALVERVAQLEAAGHVIDLYLNKPGLSYAQRIVAIKTMRTSAWLLDRRPNEAFTPNVERIERETGIAHGTVTGTLRLLRQPGGIFTRVKAWWPNGHPRLVLQATNRAATSAAEVFTPPADFLASKPPTPIREELAETYPPCADGHAPVKLVITTERRENLVCGDGLVYADRGLSKRRRVVDLSQTAERNDDAECKDGVRKTSPRVRLKNRERSVLRVGEEVPRVDSPPNSENWPVAAIIRVIESLAEPQDDVDLEADIGVVDDHDRQRDDGEWWLELDDVDAEVDARAPAEAA